MTANGLLLPVVTHLSGFIGFLAVALLGMALLHMIGKSN